MRFRSPLYLLAAVAVCLSLLLLPSSPSLAEQPSEPARTPGIQGAFVSEPVPASVFDGDLRDLPQISGEDGPSREVPRPPIPDKKWPAAPASFVDPVVQTWQGAGEMPLPIMNFEGVDKASAGGWIPPDTNGDVGPNHYFQTVNVGLGIYDKSTGSELVKVTYNTFFSGIGAPPPCDTQNRGDVIVLYDHMADRWIVTDFSLPSGGPYYECIAVSQTGDPVGGGWYSYAFVASPAGAPWHDYPKLGVWPDAYYMTANMFDPASGAKVWALDRTAMLAGAPLTAVSFDLGTSYWSLLPANLEGPLPPAGAPNYLASGDFPNVLRLWEFDVDWTNPGNSSLTGPTNLTVADFGLIWDIPQQAPGWDVDSLGDRLMMQLQYRNFGSHESLWVNHTVASGGVAGVRWYEVRDPGGTPYVYQQGTYRPDDGLYRWMGSLAVDGDGNMAVGYSVSSEVMMPAIRYAGRLAGEIPGALPQAETSLIEGTGVQVGSSRWGDYSAMTIDPVDDCTFWYTQEYYEVNGSAWQTRIGSFRFPSCGQPKGWISGTVQDADTLAGIPGVPVVAEGMTTTLTVETGANGEYSMTLPADTYAVTAGPLPPGYPHPETVPAVVVSAGQVTSLDIALTSVPYLVEGAVSIDDAVSGGNGNGYPEPGESDVLLWESLENTGATTATNVTAHLTALTPGVTVGVADVPYPDIGAGETMSNVIPFEFSIAPTIPCGAVLDFAKVITADQGVYTASFSLEAMIPLPVTSVFGDDMESGPGNWTTGGANNFWQITTEEAHSPTHAWSDSPSSNYPDNANSWLRSPVFDLSGTSGVRLSFWHQYATETAWDWGFVEYSVDGGTTWQGPLAAYTGSQDTWVQEILDVPAFDDQFGAVFRFRFQSDSNTNEDGWYIDDVDLSYAPFECTFPLAPPAVPTLLSPPDGTITTTQNITFAWQAGGGEQADGYNLEVGGTVVTTTETTTATMLATGVYTWRVRAFNAAGHSDYADAWALTIEPPYHYIYLPIVLRGQ